LEKKKILVMFQVIALMAVAMVPIGNSVSTPLDVTQPHGPRRDLVFRFYGSPSAAYNALINHDVDLMCYNLDCGQLGDAEADPNIQVTAFDANEYFGYDLNNNYTVSAAFPSVRNPLNSLHFRRAIAYAIDKNFIVNFFVNGLAYRIDVPIPHSQNVWWNPDVVWPNYPYEFNMTKAEEELALAGFVDTDSDGIRNYPLGWPGAEDGRNMDPLIICVRTDSKNYVIGIGDYIVEQLFILGIPTNVIRGSNVLLHPRVFGDRNYHIYTSVGWVKKYQPLYWLPIFHSKFWYPYGPNYVTGMNASNLPNYPDLDKELDASYYAPDIQTAMINCKDAQQIFVYQCISIPLFSPINYMAWRKELVGVVNMAGYGLNNKYTYLNAYRADNSSAPIRVALPTAPLSLNPLYSPTNPLAPEVMYSDWQVLDENMYPHLINENPYDLSVLQPWVAQDWEVGTWTDTDGTKKTNITFYLRKDVGIVAPNGTYVRNLNAHDIEFSIWYLYAFDDGWNWHSVMDVHHTEIIDDFTIKIYFNNLSFWFLYAVGEQMPILPKYELIDQLCKQKSVSFFVDGVTNGTAGWKYLLPTTSIVQVISADISGLPLTEGDDYLILGNEMIYCHNIFECLRDLGAGIVTITYWTSDVDPHGYYLAGLHWTSTWYSAGLFHPIDIVPGVGGYVSFKRNEFFFLETPPLGETDWRWYWEAGGGPGRPGRDSGYFEINIYDVVKAAASYCHRGDGLYDPLYFPGADLDPVDLCHIGIYDIVTICGKYGMKWGTPPSDP